MLIASYYKHEPFMSFCDLFISNFCSSILYANDNEYYFFFFSERCHSRYAPRNGAHVRRSDY